MLLVAAALPGCAGNGPELQSLSVQPAAETVTAVTTSPEAAESKGVTIPGATGSATDIYSEIARGAMGCWFAVGGPLKKDYIFHATADAPSRGGKAEVVIHERDPTQPNPRGPKAYVIEIQPTGEASASVTAENRKMSDAFATAMTDDISRWSKGQEGCIGASTPASWAPALPETAAAAPAPKKGKTKAKLKAAQAKPPPQP